MTPVQILLTVLFSSFKFAATFPLVIIQFEFSFLETVFWTNVGGIAGIYFFAFLSEKLISWWKRTFRRSNRKILEDEQQVKKIFTRRNRRIVRTKMKYGLTGIALITGIYTRPAVIIIIGMLTAFVIAISINLFRGHEFDCGCFSSDTRRTAGAAWRTLGRDVIFMMLGIYIFIFGQRKNIKLEGQ